ncbi:MAG: DNA/RNA nuclease SfsA [Lachnospiraceae bacterium]|nr:DNA/RNA nuclease SfsA [Lachnospiraceae bacterium]
MRYSKTLRAKFIDRPNRFIAHVELSGKVETVHVKNTGRCRELLIPGVMVILEKSDNESRKTKYDLIAVYKKNFGLINIDSQAPNKVAREWLESKNYSYIRPEYTYGKSRIDFYMEDNSKKYLMEVKGCTLERDKVGYFPDAPTERGVKHIYELIKAKNEGYHSILAFVIQMEGVCEVLPNTEMQPEFKVAMDDARKAGVEIIFIKCKVYEDRLEWI